MSRTDGFGCWNTAVISPSTRNVPSDMLKASNLIGSALVRFCVNSSVNLLPCFLGRTSTVPGTTLSSSSQIFCQDSFGELRWTSRSTLAAFPPSGRRLAPPSGSCIARSAVGSIRYARMPAKKRHAMAKRLSPPTMGNTKALGSIGGTIDSTLLFQWVEPFRVVRRNQSPVPSALRTIHDSVATSKLLPRRERRSMKYSALAVSSSGSPSFTLSVKFDGRPRAELRWDTAENPPRRSITACRGETMASERNTKASAKLLLPDPFRPTMKVGFSRSTSDQKTLRKPPNVISRNVQLTMCVF